MYLTIYKTNQTTQHITDYNSIMQNTDLQDSVEYYRTTIKIDNPKPYTELSNKQQEHLLKVIEAITEAYTLLEPYFETYSEQYSEFYVPKRTRGLRRIDAPNETFKNILTKVKDIFEIKIKCLEHNCAHAYIKKHSPKTAMEVHQKNESNWFLKTDIKDFFPKCTPEIIYTQLLKLYPFYYLEQINPTSNIQLKKIIETCCLNNGLPQGTPISPLLTNLTMVAYDYELNNYLKRGTGEHYVYTRYADDFIISSKSDFDYQQLENQINNLIAPFATNPEKTRYGSKAGSNWNLGLMLNKDNTITLGHKKKKRFNAMLNNFLNDYTNNRPWSREDTYVLQGQLSQLKHIEPTYHEHLTNKYQDKYNCNLKEIIKQILN